MGHGLHRVSFLLFWITMAVVLLKLTGLPIANYIGAALLAAVLPAFASAAFAIRNHAEFDITAQRSQSMRVKLSRLRQQLADAPCDSKALADILLKTAETTMGETADWLQIFEVKQSETA